MRVSFNEDSATTVVVTEKWYTIHSRWWKTALFTALVERFFPREKLTCIATDCTYLSNSY